ncbi:hypothetical protein [Achromobacter mucicolens]|uniref:Uncharacterized protein n=1 Tax=Achromobacter mucicolens TaxID=1389922 RepID=A0ABM8LLM1_9BURK|nr:hypothetical protein [Achromobacter mucicolens]CAB3918992.1 hypothetical protein LMG3415_05409 [Achromobacter mucicolens]
MSPTYIYSTLSNDPRYQLKKTPSESNGPLACPGQRTQSVALVQPRDCLAIARMAQVKRVRRERVRTDNRLVRAAPDSRQNGKRGILRVEVGPA